MSGNYTKTPRIYIEASLRGGQEIDVDKDRAHYLKNVLRLKEEASLRLFNGYEGEWLGEIRKLDKKGGVIKLIEQLKPQLTHKNAPRRRVHLVFPPIKKARQDFLIEKAVELGVTDLHPVLTEFTQVRDLNTERVEKQIIEAAEQCERQDIPKIHHLQDLTTVLAYWPKTTPLMICVERADIPMITSQDMKGDVGVFIGPEGGLSEAEIAMARKFKPVSLGPSVLRSETAGISALACIMTHSAL